MLKSVARKDGRDKNTATTMQSLMKGEGDGLIATAKTSKVIVAWRAFRQKNWRNGEKGDFSATE